MISHSLTCLKFLLFERDYCWLFFHFSFFYFKPLSFRNIASNLINGTLPSQLKHLKKFTRLYELVLFEEKKTLSQREEELISYFFWIIGMQVIIYWVEQWSIWMALFIWNTWFKRQSNWVSSSFMLFRKREWVLCDATWYSMLFSIFSISTSISTPTFNSSIFTTKHTSSSLVIVIVIFVFGFILIGVLYWLKRRKDRNSVLIIDWEEEEGEEEEEEEGEEEEEEEEEEEGEEEEKEKEEEAEQ